MSATTTKTTTVGGATDDVMTPLLEDIVQALNDNDYASVANKCKFLLWKQKQPLEMAKLTEATQRLLLQAWMLQDDYKSVVDWVHAQKQQKDFGLYAQYRLGEDYYTTVISQIQSAPLKEMTILKQHVLAQSQFHAHQSLQALKLYQGLLRREKTPNMERSLYTNAVAMMIAQDCVPYVEELAASTRLWEQALEFLEQHHHHQDDKHDEDLWLDLALNVGTLQSLMLPPAALETDWLETAKDICDDEDDDDKLDPSTVASIEINYQWSRHFWYQEDALSELSYPIKGGDDDNNTKDPSSGAAARVAIAKGNQALLEEYRQDAASSSGKKQQSKKAGNKNALLLQQQPHPKWNPLQVKMYWYNRAVQQYHAQQFVECQESCQSLKKQLVKNNNKSGDGTTAMYWWWSSRSEVLLAMVQQAQGKPSDGLLRLEKFWQGLETAASKASSSSNAVWDHAMALVQLQMEELKNNNNSKGSNKQNKRAMLQSLPASMQSKPAVQAMMDVLGTEDDDDDDSGSKSNKKKQKSPLEQAEALFRQGQYHAAADLYETALQQQNKGNTNDDELVHHQLQYVQALGICGKTDASQHLWESLQQETNETSSLDGEALELQGLPRNSTSLASDIMKQSTQSEQQQQQATRSREAVLRQRARRREAYLKKLQENGDYNPERPTKPFAERWIPKYERSRARKRGQQQKSSQGGGYNNVTGDAAARLDAAARRAAGGTTTTSSSGAPSTANLKVVSEGMGRKGGRRR